MNNTSAKMENLKEVISKSIRFPFVWDKDGYHVMAGKYHIWAFVNDITGDFDVTVDKITEKEELNVEWESFNSPEYALKKFYSFFHKYMNV